MQPTGLLHGSPQKRLPPAFAGAVLVGCMLFAVIAVVLYVLPDAVQRTRFSDLTGPVIDVIAASSLLVAAWYTTRHSKRLALAWGILGLAILSYAAGDISWAILESFGHEAPFPSIADAFYIAFYLVSLRGVVFLLKRPAGTRESINTALDLALILAAATLGMGNLLIVPILQSNVELPLVAQAILVAYPVGDLVLLGGLLLIVYHDPQAAIPAPREAPSSEVHQPAIPIFLLAAGMSIMIVTDCIYTYQALLETYSSGDMIDMGWIGANLVIALAGAAQVTSMQPGNRISAYEPGPVFQLWAMRIRMYLPYVWLVAALALLIVGSTNRLPMSSLSIALGVSLILGLVLIRHFVTLSQNEKLNVQLRDQTVSLESINRDLYREMAERLRVQEKLAFDVLHDHMTGLANRRLFQDRLGQAIKRGRRHQGMCFAVLFLDLDQFKVVNDSLGHASGDQLLISLGRRLEENLRSGDTVARFGGDEFAILLDDLDDETAARNIADKLQEVIAQPHRIKSRDVHVTASIGIVTGPGAYEHAEDLLRDVDLAMYQAKARGKARSVIFHEQMRDQAFSRLSLEDGLRGGLKNGEFVLFYQPITSLESDKVVSVEALLRWRHPTRGLLLPAEFLEVAEESDLILPIGEWVLGQACRQLKSWQDQYPNLQGIAVNVNLSNREFAQPDLVQKVAAALAASTLPGSCLRLEITERVLVENYPNSNMVISTLNDMGVKVEIDDFGTGYSALAYLQQFPINGIKIDKSFINEMRKNRKGLGLVRAIVSMARELGIETIAEGIETGEQLSELKGLLCGYGQGYLLSLPLDGTIAGELLSKLNRER